MMLKSLTAALKLSSIREKLNDLNAVAELTDDQKTEERDLLASQKTVEVEYRSALTDEADTTTTPDDAETRERLQLVSRASLGAIFARAVEHRATDGAESELQAALDLAPNQVPVDLLRAPVEHRAITPAPTHVGASEQAVLMPIFADGDAAFLGVDQVTVPNGDAVFPVLTNRPTVGGPHSDSTEVAETTGAFTAELVKPERLQAAFTYRRVDVARFSAMGDSLRQALNESLSESLDVQIVSGADGLLANLDAHAASGGRHVRDVCRQVWILPRRWPVRVEREIRQGADGLADVCARRQRLPRRPESRVRHRSADDDHGWRAG